MIVAALALAVVAVAPQAAGAPASDRPGAAIVASPEKAPAVAPDLPLSNDGAAAVATAGPKDDLTALADGDAPKEIEPVWKAIAVARRHLLIMGSSDGFAAAGAPAPCFPGRDASSLDARLIAEGFGDSYAERLPEALGRMVAGSTPCADPTSRTYDAGYVMRLASDDLAVYLTGAVRAYARVKPCPAEVQSAAALAAVTVLGVAEADTSPVDALRIGLVEGCSSAPKR